MKDSADRNYEWFKANLPQLITEYSGQYVIILNEAVLKALPSFDEALNEALKHAVPGEFIIQKCTVDESETVQTFCSLIRLPKLA